MSLEYKRASEIFVERLDGNFICKELINWEVPKTSEIRQFFEFVPSNTFLGENTIGVLVEDDATICLKRGQNGLWVHSVLICKDGHDHKESFPCP